MKPAVRVPMPELLPRLKPDPVPAIHPVPEYAAQGSLLACYEKTKAGLGVPWMGVVAMAFAHYPTFYDRLWSALQPLVGRQRFHQACDDLREQAQQQAATLGQISLQGPLIERGYDSAELTDVRACIEVFSAGNMPYILMATLARRLLEGHTWTGAGDAGPLEARPQHAKPPLMEAHHADGATQALYEDLKATLGLPFVNTDYRAFARWPSYFDLAWPDLKSRVLQPGYAQAVTQVHETAQTLLLELPNLEGLSPVDLQQAAEADASLEEVLAVVRLFQWLLPGLAVNVACLRAQLEPA
ncbi:hypothetical protein ACTL6U_09225 [Rhodovibrionaceae bacterium A322]